MSNCIDDFWNSVGKEQIKKGTGISVRTKEIKEYEAGTRKFDDIGKDKETHIEKVKRIAKINIHCMSDEEFDFYIKYKKECL